MSAISELTPHDLTSRMLLELGIPAHRVGYRQLCAAVPYFAENKDRCLTKDVYPYVADTLGYSDWRAVEHSVRQVILDAWRRRNRAVWERYFSNGRKPPSSKQFIATLAEYL